MKSRFGQTLSDHRSIRSHSSFDANKHALPDDPAPHFGDSTMELISNVARRFENGLTIDPLAKENLPIPGLQTGGSKMAELDAVFEGFGGFDFGGYGGEPGGLGKLGGFGDFGGFGGSGGLDDLGKFGGFGDFGDHGGGLDDLGKFGGFGDFGDRGGGPGGLGKFGGFGDFGDHGGGPGGLGKFGGFGDFGDHGGGPGDLGKFGGFDGHGGGALDQFVGNDGGALKAVGGMGGLSGFDKVAFHEEGNRVVADKGETLVYARDGQHYQTTGSGFEKQPNTEFTSVKDGQKTDWHIDANNNVQRGSAVNSSETPPKTDDDGRPAEDGHRPAEDGHRLYMPADDGSGGGPSWSSTVVAQDSASSGIGGLGLFDMPNPESDSPGSPSSGVAAIMDSYAGALHISDVVGDVAAFGSSELAKSGIIVVGGYEAEPAPSIAGVMTFTDVNHDSAMASGGVEFFSHASDSFSAARLDLDHFNIGSWLHA